MDIAAHTAAMLGLGITVRWVAEAAGAIVALFTGLIRSVM